VTEDLDEPTGIPESTPQNDPTFPVMVERKGVWMIQQVVHPGMPFPKTDQTMALPAYRWQQYALALRWKVNAAILRFEDEPDTMQIELNLTEAEGWILDQNIQFDGAAGVGALLLIEIFRGMWHLRMEEMGSTLPSELVPEPAPVPAEEKPEKGVPQEPHTDMAMEIYRLMDEELNKPEETA
jgi:hypothetical protein